MKLARQVRRFMSKSAATRQRPDLLTKTPTSNNSIKLHARLIGSHLHTDPFSISQVIRAYALSPPNLTKARLAFDQVEGPMLPLWNHLIPGLSLSDNPNEAIHLYSCMHRQGFVGDNLTFIFVLKACARVSDLLVGQIIHVHAFKLGFESHLFVVSALIRVYICCWFLGFARKAFDEMTERDLVSWNSLICGCAKWNGSKEVLGLFRKTQADDVRADSVMVMKVIMACSYLEEYEVADSLVKYVEENRIGIKVYLGNTITDMYGRRGLVKVAREGNVVSLNAMIMGYVKAGDLVLVRKLFNEMAERDLVSWTAMTTGYSQANQIAEAVRLFQE